MVEEGVRYTYTVIRVISRKERSRVKHERRGIERDAINVSSVTPSLRQMIQRVGYIRKFCIQRITPARKEGDMLMRFDGYCSVTFEFNFVKPLVAGRKLRHSGTLHRLDKRGIFSWQIFQAISESCLTHLFVHDTVA